MNQREFETYILEIEIPLKGYLNRFAIMRNELEDLYQETWEKAFSKKDQFDPLKSSFKTWLFTIATHLTIDN